MWVSLSAGVIIVGLLTFNGVAGIPGWPLCIAGALGVIFSVYSWVTEPI